VKVVEAVDRMGWRDFALPGGGAQPRAPSGDESFGAIAALSVLAPILLLKTIQPGKSIMHFPGRAPLGIAIFSPRPSGERGEKTVGGQGGVFLQRYFAAAARTLKKNIIAIVPPCR
jgi:hypothetical protein